MQGMSLLKRMIIDTVPNNEKSRIRRIIWASIGFLALLLGLIGIPLPLLPTTPFLILAAFCFSQSSERLHRWLMSHPTLSPPIKNWQRYGAISQKAKLGAGAAMLGALVISYLLGVNFYILIVQIVVLIGVSCFIFTRPGPPNSD